MHSSPLLIRGANRYRTPARNRIGRRVPGETRTGAGRRGVDVRPPGALNDRRRHASRQQSAPSITNNRFPAQFAVERTISSTCFVVRRFDFETRPSLGSTLEAIAKKEGELLEACWKKEKRLYPGSLVFIRGESRSRAQYHHGDGARRAHNHGRPVCRPPARTLTGGRRGAHTVDRQ